MTSLLTPGRSDHHGPPKSWPRWQGLPATPIAIKRTFQVPPGQIEAVWRGGQLASGTARLTYHWLG